MTGHTGRLRRILGVGFGLGVSVGGTLGVGILRMPGEIAAQLHAPSVIVAAWLAGGLYTLLVAICLTELGTMVPQDGGYCVYARRAFGDWIGLAVGWTDWSTSCAALGYLSIAMSEFLAALIPGLAGAIRPTAIAILIGFVVLQWAGVRISSWFQEWTTAIKCAAFLALVVAAFALSGRAAPAPTAPAPPVTLTGASVALQQVVMTYAGWQGALYFTEEDRDPDRNLPRVVIGSVLAVLAIYLLVNLALLAILPIAELSGSTLPAADAARHLAGARGAQIITVLSLIAAPPILNSVMMVGTRILFALGRDRLVWSRAADINAGGTPGIATLITTAVAVALIATGTFQRLVAIAALYLALNYAICCVALVVLRRREPATPRPFRAWGYPWSAAIVVAGALAFLPGAVLADPAAAGLAAALLAAGLAIHAVRLAIGRLRR
ncbi:MAG TPA: APC family permease [Kofleriaceae bacterium]|jgi:APA family basic amino acid/polyamine antiporter|nr:APC family permease [Kofleriaceae bacterium]